METTGTTPFELAEEQRAQGGRTITTGYATQKLIELLQECNITIAAYRDAASFYHRDPTEGNRKEMEDSLLEATEALKEKKSAEAALVEIARMAEKLGMVA
jgi:hypothetical protein|tara:strand:+ start:1558 stop:1860 length:303 start_codon:yes stop_codon:yes gene_type:complete